MTTKNRMHALAAMLLSLAIVVVSTLGSVQCVFARTIEFRINTGKASASKDTATVKKDTVTKKGSVAGISYDKLVMANVEEAVNVRSEASETSNLIGKFYKECGGEILERKNGWTKVKTGTLTGWIKDTYLLFGDEAVKLAETAVTKTATSKTSSLRIREDKSTDSDVLELMAEGDKIEAINDDGEWVQVEFSDGEIGYVKSEYVTVKEALDCGESIEQIKERENALKKEKEKADKVASSETSGQKAASGAATNNGAIAGDVNDTLLLAALIQSESGYEPYQGQVAVGTVVMNRLRTGKYGTSIYSVIYAKGQFGPAGTGKVASIYAQGPKQSCIQAAQEAMSGVSYIGTATHFRSIKSGIPGIVIGNHVFW